jgi:hypothetical protein
MAIIKGTAAPQQNKRSWTFNRRTGWTSTQTFEGERQNILRLAGRYSTIADTLNVNTDGPTATMTAQFGKDDTAPNTPNADVMPTTWELMGQSVQRDVSDNPKANAIKDFRDITHIKKQAKDILDPSKTVTITNALATSLPSGTGWSSVHKVLLYKYAFRQENSLTTEWVLRKNQVVTSNYELRLATSGVDQIWTATQLFRGETDVPVALMSSVSATTKPAAALFDGSGDLLNSTNYSHVYGWLKQAPQMTYTTGGQVERSQEWWLNYWFTFDYPLYG